MQDFRISEAMDELLLALSRGPVADKPWEEFLHLLAAAVNADFATLILRPPSEGDEGVVINSVIVSKEIYDSYNRDYYALDPFVDLPQGQVYTVDQFMPLQEYYESDYYQAYGRDAGIVHLMGADMGDELGNTARLRLSRTDGKENFGKQEQALCARILPHLQQSIRLHARIERLDSERATFAGAIDQLSVGAFILDESTAIRRTNHAADQLLAEGTWLRSDNGQLRVGSADDNQRFKTLLEEVMAAHNKAEPSFARVFRMQGEAAHAPGMLLRPLPRTEASGGVRNPSVAIFVSDPAHRREPPRDVLMELLGLTRAEARLALQLANGATLDEAANNLNVSRNTAKSHLSAVFSKTGVARQSQLVQLILRSVAPMG